MEYQILFSGRNDKKILIISCLPNLLSGMLSVKAGITTETGNISILLENFQRK